MQTTAHCFNLGEFAHNNLIPFERNLRDATPECIIDEEKELFLDFMRKMLCWLPEERATAKELKRHPWVHVIPDNPK